MRATAPFIRGVVKSYSMSDISWSCSIIIVITENILGVELLSIEWSNSLGKKKIQDGSLVNWLYTWRLGVINRGLFWFSGHIEWSGDRYIWHWTYNTVNGKFRIKIKAPGWCDRILITAAAKPDKNLQSQNDTQWTKCKNSVRNVKGLLIK